MRFGRVLDLKRSFCRVVRVVFFRFVFQRMAVGYISNFFGFLGLGCW